MHIHANILYIEKKSFFSHFFFLYKRKKKIANLSNVLCCEEIGNAKLGCEPRFAKEQDSPEGLQ